MPEKGPQFDYPTEDWAVGKMAKIGPMRGGAGASEFRELEGQRKRRESRVSQATPGGQALSQEEWGNYWKGNWDVVGKSGKVDPNRADGVIIHKGHDQIQELQNRGWETLSFPDSEKGSTYDRNFLFMRPPMDDKTPVGWQGPGPGRIA